MDAETQRCGKGDVKMELFRITAILEDDENNRKFIEKVAARCNRLHQTEIVSHSLQCGPGFIALHYSDGFIPEQEKEKETCKSGGRSKKYTGTKTGTDCNYYDGQFILTRK
jgi:hypothetical protein